MSKSDTDSNSYIQLTDPSDIITRKIRKAVTDSTSLVSYDPETRPGVATLIDIDAACTGRDPDEIAETCELMAIDTGMYKKEVSDRLIQHLEPIQKKYLQLMKDKVYLRSLLDKGANKANNIASKHYEEVCRIVGMK